MAEPIKDPDDKFLILSPRIGPLSIEFNGEPLVTIYPDGTLKYGEHYTPDAAAQVFWDALGAERKNRLP